MKLFFYQVPYGKEAARWDCGKFETKKDVSATVKGATDIMTGKQLIEKLGKEGAAAAVKNCKVFNPEAEKDFPKEIADLL